MYIADAYNAMIDRLTEKDALIKELVEALESAPPATSYMKRKKIEAALAKAKGVING